MSAPADPLLAALLDAAADKRRRLAELENEELDRRLTALERRLAQQEPPARPSRLTRMSFGSRLALFLAFVLILASGGMLALYLYNPAAVTEAITLQTTPQTTIDPRPIATPQAHSIPTQAAAQVYPTVPAVDVAPVATPVYDPHVATVQELQAQAAAAQQGAAVGAQAVLGGVAGSVPEVREGMQQGAAVAAGGLAAQQPAVQTALPAAVAGGKAAALGVAGNAPAVQTALPAAVDGGTVAAGGLMSDPNFRAGVLAGMGLPVPTAYTPPQATAPPSAAGSGASVSLCAICSWLGGN